MKIQLENKVQSRDQMSHLMSRLIVKDRSLGRAAKLGGKFLNALRRPGVVEMHVLMHIEDADQIEHPELLRGIQKSRARVMERIDTDGFCVVSVARPPLRQALTP